MNVFAVAKLSLLAAVSLSAAPKKMPTKVSEEEMTSIRGSAAGPAKGVTPSGTEPSGLVLNNISERAVRVGS